jgi:hypothetical protein
MKTYYCKIDNKDKFTSDAIIDLNRTSFSFWRESGRRINKYIFGQIDDAILDLLYISSFVYLADCISPRAENLTNWEREFKLTIPLLKNELFDNIKVKLVETFSFLSGDKWDFEFVPRQYTEIEKYNKEKCKQLRQFDAYDCVAMLSGGLDSLVGAIDLLEEKKKVLFVGSHGRGANVKPYQDYVYNCLSEEYKIQNDFKQFSLERYSDGNSPYELTTRSRSINFFAHAIAMANIYRIKKIIIPENGFISLNIPLSNSRLGSSSTRTTHPYYLFLLNDILKYIGSDIYLRNPYQFKTKGEMMTECKNRNLLEKMASYTMSCSHPSDRYKGTEARADSHCGYCVPCVIRRAAFKKAQLEDKSIYRDVHHSSPTALQNYRSFEFGVLLREDFSVFDVLRSGKLLDYENIEKYFSLYSRGIEEIKDLLMNE